MKKSLWVIFLVLNGFTAFTAWPATNHEIVITGSSAWSKPNNGLSIKLTFNYDDSDSYAKVIHPKILLRNDSKESIKFLKSIYNAGKFLITDSNGSKIQRKVVTRSGPQEIEVVTIKPTETIEFDVYDYGYGVNPDHNIYVFNTSSVQADLKPGNYTIDYTLALNEEMVEKALSDVANWIKEDPKTIWIGEISINDIPIVLK